MAPGNIDASVSARKKIRILCDIKCVKCCRIVRNGILCDVCDKWSHFRCGNVNELELPEDDAPWTCPRCTNEEPNKPVLPISNPLSDSDQVNLAAIVEVLRRDIERLEEENKNLRSVSTSTSLPKSDVQSNHNLTRPTHNRGWESVPYKNNRKPTNRDLRNDDFPPLTYHSNRYSILANCNDELATPKTSTSRTTSNLTSKVTLPTNKVKKPLSFIKPKPKHRIKIYSDSFGRGLTKLVKHNLGNRIEVDGMVKPSAKLEQVVPNDKSLLDSDNDYGLTTEDFVVIIGGANDVYNGELIEATTALKTTLDSLGHTNVVYVNVPHRFDLTHDSRINEDITKANNELKNICKSYKNVFLVNTSSCDRSYHTRHGQHFSYKGKKVLANVLRKIVRDRINQFVDRADKIGLAQSDKSEPIPPSFKDPSFLVAAK